MQNIPKITKAFLISKGIFLSIFTISILLNLHSYREHGFSFGNTKETPNFSGVGYDKERAEELYASVERIENEKKARSAKK